MLVGGCWGLVFSAWFWNFVVAYGLFVFCAANYVCFGIYGAALFGLFWLYWLIDVCGLSV